MMLTIPVYTPFTAFKNVDSSGITMASGSKRGLRYTESNHKKATRSSSCSQPSRGRGCVVLASARDGADGLPLRESAEKRKVLLKYVKEVQPTLMEQFVDVGPPAVVAAMRNTITNMLGTLPPQFFTVTISTVGENMSQLMLSVLMTGYMFRNAQYRLELHSALGGLGPTPAGMAGGAGAVAAAAARPFSSSSTASSTSRSVAGTVMQRSQSAPVQGSVLDEDTYAPGVQKSRVQGDVLLWHKENGLETLDAVQYIELLEGEVTRLRQQLDKQQQPKLPPPTAQSAQQQPEVPRAAPPPLQGETRQLPVPVSPHHALQQPGSSAVHLGPAGGLLVLDEGSNELLDYLRCLDSASMAELTGSAGAEVAAAMDSFVARLMGTGDRDSLSRAGSDCTAQELAKVMFWLMVVGYTLRGMEVRWDIERGYNYSKAQQGGRLGGWMGGSKDSSHETW